MAAVRKLWAERGVASLLVGMPEAVAGRVAFSLFRAGMCAVTGGASLPILGSATPLICNLACSFATIPFELVFKRRVVQALTSGHEADGLAIAQDVAQSEGVSSFWSGFRLVLLRASISLALVAPAIALSAALRIPARLRT
ncbi:uncharacterized protein AMSG_11701 [Thecamonas trahens ATCC 50062]|uniref:Uncharacterized protein n=1 Tax=Thecamonas trahens ATCC 50062 TaxID=461836 RepID=A0A0L0DW14_THETB|nr:hypothetical protein AMSG_11701 [Thecamonas trahens ATCC 50062]KNC56266.1 hypothetical protein AMSG_11701 [Thecamonas trahens ATCC 50062]|eukprot:XP_013760994.1 hypothetical protein AMSG_11701 [Thecamonas trahens ATCC 50062]